MNFIIDMNMEDNKNMAITPKGLKYLLIGLLVMVSGYILMMGGGSDDPQFFNYAMFDFRRMVAAPDKRNAAKYQPLCIARLGQLGKVKRIAYVVGHGLHLCRGIIMRQDDRVFLFL